MNYIRLTNLTNQYPQPGNYIPKLIGGATLFGLYEETNKIDFEFFDFSEVIPIEGISTRFIFAITYDKSLSQVIDEDGLKIQTPLDITKKEKVNLQPNDTPIDSFISNAKSTKRKKKKKLFGSIVKLAAGALLAPGLIAPSIIIGGIVRNNKRKKQKANQSLLQRQSTPEETIVSAPDPLTGLQQRYKETAIARRNERRDRIFGTKLPNLQNSTLPNEKPPLVGDDNLPKTRIFSDLKVINDDNIATKLFCSQQYYNDLKSAKNSANPYFINFSFKPEFMVEVNTMPLIELVDSFLDNELNNGVLMKRNNYIVDGNIDFEKIARYVNWVVTKPTLAEIDTNGVVPANLLCEYEKGDFDKKTGKWSTSVEQKSNTTTDSSESGNTSNTVTSGPPPVGRPGTSTGEVVDVDGEPYVWLGSYWKPTRTGGGSGGSGGFGGNGGPGRPQY